MNTPRRSSVPPLRSSTEQRRGDPDNLSSRFPDPASPDSAVFVISVAAELTGLHPQTLRTYERMGLITPGRTGGGGRRYSPRDIDLLREIAQLTASGIGIEGVRRILELEDGLAALAARNEELVAELEATREALCRAATGLRPTSSRVPAVPQQPPTGQSIVVWRRNR